MADLVLPIREKEIIQNILVHIRQRDRVYEDWDFGNKGDRGLGSTVFFVGESGTGKTMAFY